MKISILYAELKKNKLIINLLLIFIFLYPISIVAGPALIELTIFLSIIVFALSFNLNEIKKLYFKSDIKILLVFYLAIIISSILSDNSLISLKSSVFSIRFLLFSVIIYILLKRIKFFEQFIFLISIKFFIICVFDGYLQLLTGKNIFLYDTSSDFVTGLFFEEKKLGRYLISFSPILVGLYLSLGNKTMNFKLINSYIFLNFVFFIVLFTSERVSMFYAIFTILIIIIFGLKYSKKYLLLILLPCLIFVSSYSLNINNFSNTVNDSFKQITDNNNSFSYPSKQHRGFMTTSFELFKEKPVLGIGPNNYRHDCKNIIIKEVRYCSTHPHNIFFQIMAETGIIGLLIYIYFIFMTFKKIIKFIFNKNDLNVSIFFLLPILYFLNPFFPSGNFFNNWFMAIGTFSLPFYLYFNEFKIKKN